MKEIRISPAAEDALADILEYSIDQWGLARSELYKDQLLERVRSVARGELPHPRPCSVLVQGERAGTGLCYCREGRHFIILRWWSQATACRLLYQTGQALDMDHRRHERAMQWARRSLSPPILPYLRGS